MFSCFFFTITWEYDNSLTDKWKNVLFSVLINDNKTKNRKFTFKNKDMVKVNQQQFIEFLIIIYKPNEIFAYNRYRIRYFNGNTKF